MTASWLQSNGLRFVSLALAKLLIVASTPAGAMDFGRGDGFSLKVGGAVGVRPKYEGSSSYKVYGLPIILPSFSRSGPLSGIGQFVEVRGPDDVRFKLLRDVYGFSAGPLVGYAFGRDQDDAAILEGLGDVDGGVIVGAFASYRFHWLLADVAYKNQVSGADGAQLAFALGIEHAISPAMEIRGQVGTTYADEDYIQSYFGITNAQALTSRAGLRPYQGEAGFKDIFVETGLKTEIWDRWSLRTTLKYSRLIGDAADSPVVQSEDQFSGLIGLSYRLDFK